MNILSKTSDPSDHVAGVFNVNEIVRGLFQSAYLGFGRPVFYSPLPL